jgi:Cu-Zn family superoxide dismutase
MRSLAALCLAAVLAACATSSEVAAPAPPTAPKTSWIVGADGRAIGQASFTAAPGGVLIRLEFSERALTPGWHGTHIHEIGQCADVADGFRASGSHAGHADSVQHGLLNPNGPEAGDLPNVYAPPAGPFSAEFFSPLLTLGAEADEGSIPLLDADGSALIVHAGPDDHFSQPIGGAGARVGCAVISLAP